MRLMASSADPSAAAKGWSHPKGTADSKSKNKYSISKNHITGVSEQVMIMEFLAEPKTGHQWNAFAVHLTHWDNILDVPVL